MLNTNNRELTELGAEIWAYQSVDAYLYELCSILENASKAIGAAAPFDSVSDDWSAHFCGDYNAMTDVPLRILVIYHALTNLFESIAEEKTKRELIEERLNQFNRSLLASAREKLLEQLNAEESSGRKNSLVRLFLHLSDKDELKPLHGMTALDLSGDLNSSSICSKLGKLSKLENLNLRNCALIDEDMPFLAKLTELKQLDLSDNPVSSLALDHLANPQQLRLLKLSGSNLNRSALPQLRRMKKLESLWLAAQWFDDENTASLQSSLPDCKIQRI